MHSERTAGEVSTIRIEGREVYLKGATEMPLYKLTGKTLVGVKSDSFAKEKDLQSLIEANLQTLFGLDFVRSEYHLLV